MRLLIAGGAGFIGSHLAKFYKDQGHFVRIADIQTKSPYFEPDDICDEYMCLDLRRLDNCIQALNDIDAVFQLAAHMGGMGYIQSNHSVILYWNFLINGNMMEATRRAHIVHPIQFYFYSSSACVYSIEHQDTENVSGLIESSAWPAHPQDAYGLEKLVAEELVMHYGRDWNIPVYIARFHNICGPKGTWYGGKEKAPAAFCRKVLTSTSAFEMWGNGEQTRSFCHINDCVEGISRLVQSEYHQPINIGSEERVSMNDMAHMIMEFDGKYLPIRHISGPEGVRGRNSDNTLLRSVLGWEPKTPLQTTLRDIYIWLRDDQLSQFPQNEWESIFSKSVVVHENPDDHTW